MSDKPLYDPQAIQSVIARVADPAQRDFLVAVVDVVTGISMAQQMRNQDERMEVYQALTDIRFQVATGNTAREANASQVAEFLKLVLEKQEAASTGQALLAEHFSTVAESVSELVMRMDASERDRQQLNARQTASERAIAQLQQDVAELRTQIAARPTPEQARATYTAMRWLVTQNGGDPDALGLP